VLEPNGFPLSKDEEATSYWEDKRDQIMPHRNELLLSSDFPFNPRIFLEKVSQWQVDLDEREAEEAITQLLNEAVALREWTIPPNAFCESHGDHLLV
jgi:hypothetical protein